MLVFVLLILFFILICQSSCDIDIVQLERASTKLGLTHFVTGRLSTQLRPASWIVSYVGTYMYITFLWTLKST